MIRHTPKPAGEWATLIAAVPFLLHRTVSDTLVVLGTSGGDIVSIAALSDPGPDIDEGHLRAGPGEVLDSIRADGAGQLILIGYGHRTAPMLRAAAASAVDLDLSVGAVLHVTDDRYRCWCDEPDCADRDGTAFDFAGISAGGFVPGVAALPAQTETAGRTGARTPHVRRGGTGDGPEDDADGIRHRLRKLLMRDVTGRRLPAGTADATMCAAAQSVITGAYAAHRDGQALAGEQVAWLRALLTSPAVRAHLISDIGTGPEYLQVWSQLLPTPPQRQGIPDLTAGPALGVAVAAALCRHHEIAVVAARAVLATEPGNALAADLVDHCVNDRPVDALTAIQRQLRARPDRRRRLRGGKPKQR